ncbi:MAG: DUF1223 domain-containing protein [Proteobacteria bacterium]|nr:DUF1223 domain-containing protein [Pseudomonadota bacterium]
MPHPSPSAVFAAIFATASAAALLLVGTITLAEAAPACSTRSAATIAPVVELYTSEGCNSCPPADRWLSGLKVEPDVVALAFHVDYWDSLGWKDRYASPAYTERQAAQQRSSGARFNYTPQVLVDGRDRRDWPAVSGASLERPPANVELTLMRDGDRFDASVTAKAAMRLAAYWAVTEDRHESAVKAGENAGVTLHHDHVVRDYLPVPMWTAAADVPTSLQFTPKPARDPAHPRSVNLVVVDAATGRPVQAVRLGC